MLERCAVDPEPRVGETAAVQVEQRVAAQACLLEGRKSEVGAQIATRQLARFVLFVHRHAGDDGPLGSRCGHRRASSRSGWVPAAPAGRAAACRLRCLVDSSRVARPSAAAPTGRRRPRRRDPSRACCRRTARRSARSAPLRRRRPGDPRGPSSVLRGSGLGRPEFTVHAPIGLPGLAHQSRTPGTQLEVEAVLLPGCVYVGRPERRVLGRRRRHCRGDDGAVGAGQQRALVQLQVGRATYLERVGIRRIRSGRRLGTCCGRDKHQRQRQRTPAGG